MKKLLTLLLTFALTLCFVACGSNDTNSDTPGNISGQLQIETSSPNNTSTDDTTSKKTSTTDSSDEQSADKPTSKPTESSKSNSNTPSTSKPTISIPTTGKSTKTSKPTETSKPVLTPTHTHSYSKQVTAATCTEKGYTTYTCSCGDTYKDNYTNPSHNYTDFICRACGVIDKINAYKHLVEYVKSNGTSNGSFVSITMREANGQKYELKYDAQNKCLWATCREATQSAVLTTTLSIEDGYYGLNYVYNASATSNLTGFIDPKTFNENSPMTYEIYTGLDNTKLTMLNLARSSLVLTIVEMERYFDTHNVGLNVYALGYMGLQ